MLMEILKAGSEIEVGTGNGQLLISPAKEESEDVPIIPRVTVIATVPSGEIRIERGADGAWLQFDCDCLDALPYCHAQCCALKGILLTSEEEEADIDPKFLEVNAQFNVAEMKRSCDGYCGALDRDTRRCTIYDNRPLTCRSFHCTRGSEMRGWKLPNQVYRHSQI